MYVEDDNLNLSPVRQNSNGYPKKDSSCGDDYSTFNPDDGHWWDTVIPDNTYVSSNDITEGRDSVLSSIHIYSSK